MGSQRLRSLYRVDTVPLLWRPLFWVYGHGLGVLIYLGLRLAVATSRVVLENVPPPRNYIYCAWHRYALLMFLSRRDDPRPHVWLNHAAWYMKPIHVVAALLRVKLVLGSTGDRGRAAADQVVDALKRGCSTVMLPDGPDGPPETMRKGAFHMAAQSGVPLVGVAISCSRVWHLPTWDRKQWPLPFGRIRVRFGPPIQVRDGEVDAAAANLRTNLDGA